MKKRVRLTRRLTLIAVLAGGCSTVSLLARATANNAEPAVQSAIGKNCPPRDTVDAALASASTLMAQSQFKDAAMALQPVANSDCDERVSLLLAAAFEGQGDVLKAIEELRKAHSMWPSNSSIAASLAREYLNRGDARKAAEALAHFHLTATTPEQEMRMAAVVYLAAHQLVQAHLVAEAANKSYPSVSTLLLLANTLQLQGRYPDVIRLLSAK